jgi:hypothetical protein
MWKSIVAYQAIWRAFLHRRNSRWRWDTVKNIADALTLLRIDTAKGIKLFELSIVYIRPSQKQELDIDALTVKEHLHHPYGSCSYTRTTRPSCAI